ncbi:MAG TPA: hypothetical protein V6D17_16655 [Candidatus Obscuribacterales bacterium]
MKDNKSEQLGMTSTYKTGFQQLRVRQIIAWRIPLNADKDRQCLAFSSLVAMATG